MSYEEMLYVSEVVQGVNTKYASRDYTQKQISQAERISLATTERITRKLGYHRTTKDDAHKERITVAFRTADFVSCFTKKELARFRA